MSELATGTRGRRQNQLLDQLQRAVSKVHRRIIRQSKGRVLGRFGRNQVIIISTLGRTSKLWRDTTVFGYEDGAGWLAVASNGGSAVPPQWFRNLLADPTSRVTVCGQVMATKATVLSPDEKSLVWPRLAASYSAFDSYQAKTNRDIAVVRFTPR